MCQKPGLISVGLGALGVREPLKIVSVCTPTHPLSTSGICKVQRRRGTRVKNRPPSQQLQWYPGKGASEASVPRRGGLAPSQPPPPPHPREASSLHEERPFLYEGTSWLHPLLSRVLRHCPKPSLPTCDRREKRSALGVGLAFLTLAPYAADHDYLESHYVYTGKTVEAHRTHANSLNAKRYQGVSSGFGAPVGGVGGGGFVGLPCRLQRQMEAALS